MSQNDQSADSIRKISEKSEKARREFFKKVEKIIKSHGHSDKLMQDTADRAAQEYNKVFGRIGVHPLLHLKGGKKAPRYVVDRDEVWVLHKPPLWKMGGSMDTWKKKVEELVKTSTSLSGAQNSMLESDKEETLQEWHGLTQGLMWMDKDQETTGWGFIQRLDLETDGPVIIAKTWRAQRCLQVQMKEHIFSKAYLCLVHGRLENRIQHIKCRFAELGSDAMTQVMLKYDGENDPFYDWSSSGRWKGRSVRMAETFFKPLAYYFRKEDGTEYTLVYVNILTGITHQVRITLQSVGHPLVGDDRYLPKDQALADLKWCPRNFLCEVRSDWFDMCGPHKDEQRRRYTRISMENPLPKHLQAVLENKLTLVEKLDPTADLFAGCQYWSIGDEQLMNAYPKDIEYRRKVMRWGQRRSIHLDALDRLLLLPKEDIDQILQGYKPPADKLEATWVCPSCMAFNQPDGRSANSVTCNGYLGKDCPGSRIVEEDIELPRGWLNFLADPTIHFLMMINPKYLDARRKVLKFSRPSWEKPPIEAEGTACTEDILRVLEAALVLDAKAGGSGISEEDLPKVPGLENIKLPLACPPEDSPLHRVRLPGRGTLSQWTYMLKGSERIKHAADFAVKTKKLLAPIAVKADPLPSKMVLTKAEKAKKDKLKEKEEKAKLDEVNEEVPDNLDVPDKRKDKWTRRESTSNPGNFYYVNAETGETRVDKPPDFVEAKKSSWSRIESKSNRGQFYYHNSETGETRVERPPGVEISHDVGSGKVKSESRVKEEAMADSDDENIAWERRESTSKPGNFYYFNPKTGSNEIHPPRVELPWKLLESKSKKGQFYYFNEDTGESDVNPPASARPATKASDTDRGVKRSRLDDEEGRRTAAKTEKLPSGWTKKESDKYKGKYYYVNSKTGETSWTRPGEWERQESKSSPGTFYYVNLVTGETSWDKKATNGK
uniref:WW domain-containing protein n=1 Tax=Alexandrium monilatum TaxID=311494 RepID=A0A7S4V5M9_9DINO|mmetsp:Transcript_1017/g.3445  ORF Transcript_1017/g.3445 Transcript_1017/m.3445 type:complete len:946 (+) Transcript_1017:132-2969(+)